MGLAISNTTNFLLIKVCMKIRCMVLFGGVNFLNLFKFPSLTRSYFWEKALFSSWESIIIFWRNHCSFQEKALFSSGECIVVFLKFSSWEIIVLFKRKHCFFHEKALFSPRESIALFKRKHCFLQEKALFSSRESIVFPRGSQHRDEIYTKKVNLKY